MALLGVSALSKSFGGLMAVSDLTFEVREGEIVSIIGPNGAGKTTLFNLITGIYRPTSGRVTFAGAEITGCRRFQAARLGIGRTFQATTIFKEATLLDNLIVAQSLHTRTGLLGAIARTRGARLEEGRVRQKALEAISFVGLAGEEAKRAGSLTEEAQKRLSIAMVLATNPSLVLLDEPTGGVNLEEVGGLMELIRGMRQRGITVCLIEHKMRMVMAISDRIIVLNYGRNIAEGTPAEVAADKEVIRAYLGSRRAS